MYFAFLLFHPKVNNMRGNMVVISVCFVAMPNHWPSVPWACNRQAPIECTASTPKYTYFMIVLSLPFLDSCIRQEINNIWTIKAFERGFFNVGQGTCPDWSGCHTPRGYLACSLWECGACILVAWWWVDRKELRFVPLLLLRGPLFFQNGHAFPARCRWCTAVSSFGFSWRLHNYIHWQTWEFRNHTRTAKLRLHPLIQKSKY